MTIFYLAYRNMVSKPLNLILSVSLLILSVSLVTFSLDLSQQIKNQLNKNISPFDMVIGAKGSPLQLVLSSVLHIDNPTGNITFKDVKAIQKHRFVKTAIPISYGDNYKGYRILGTTPEYLNQYNTELASGKLYKHPFEAVVGSNVAKILEIKIGDNFVSSHGLIASDFDTHDDHPYKVTGILKPTGSVIDQMLITNLESIWDAHHHEHNDEHAEGEAAHLNDEHSQKDGEHHEDEHNHDHHNHSEDAPHNQDDDDEHNEHSHDDAHEHEHHEGEHNHKHSEHSQERHEHDHSDHNHNHDHDYDQHNHANHFESPKIEYDEDKEITSLLVKFKNPLGMVQLPRYINENTNVQAALPAFEIQRLSHLFGSGVKTINGIALAILLVSGLSIFISLLKTIRERRDELALLRTYGFSTSQLLKLVLIEGTFLAVIGFIFGWIFGRIGIWIASQYTQSIYGYALNLNLPTLYEYAVLGIIFVIAIIATLFASSSIFKLNIAKTLSDV